MVAPSSVTPFRDIANTVTSHKKASKAAGKKSGSRRNRIISLSSSASSRSCILLSAREPPTLTYSLLKLDDETSHLLIDPSPSAAFPLDPFKRYSTGITANSSPSTVKFIPATPSAEPPIPLTFGSIDTVTNAPHRPVSINNSFDVSAYRRSFCRSSLIDTSFLLNEDEDDVFSQGFSFIEQLANRALDPPNDELRIANETCSTREAASYVHCSKNISGTDAAKLPDTSMPSMQDCDSTCMFKPTSYPSTLQLCQHVPLAPGTFQNVSKTPSASTPQRIYSLIVKQLRQVNSICPQAVVDPFEILSEYCEVEHPSHASFGAVFGQRLRIVTVYASRRIVLGEEMYIIPVVVYRCLEELYSRDIKSPYFLRADSTRAGQYYDPVASFRALFVEFNRGPSYGDKCDLSSTTTEVISSLLMTYLGCLPEGVVPPWVTAVLKFAIPGTDAYAGIGSVNAIVIAQLMLRLLPAPHFGLCVYVLAFLSQVSQYQSSNHLDSRSLAQIFGKTFFGLPKAWKSGVRNTKQLDDVELVLKWLIEHWSFVYEGLLEGCIDGSAKKEARRMDAFQLRSPLFLYHTLNSNPLNSHTRSFPVCHQSGVLHR